MDSVRTVMASHAEVMRFYDPERIQGLCRSCDKYGRFWSCPPFDVAPLGKLPAWSDAVLVTQKTRVDSRSTHENLIEQFLAARQTLGDILKRWEVDGVVALIAGHCSGCAACPRSRGIDCVAPERMRFSLEGLGFDVTALVEALVGQKIDWPTRGAPGHMLLAGALLCSSSEIAALIASQGN